jgi:Methyltransferase FkbM domain
VQSVQEALAVFLLTTISAAMRLYGISTVDLAKIDVEGAEWVVLEGIDEADWPRIRQLALELHDVDDRIARKRDLLETKGYRVLVDDADWATHRLMGVRCAVRQCARTPLPPPSPSSSR